MKEEIRKSISPIITLILVCLLLPFCSPNFCSFLQNDFYDYSTIPKDVKSLSLSDGSSLYFSLCYNNNGIQGCSDGNILQKTVTGNCEVLTTASKWDTYKWKRTRYDSQSLSPIPPREIPKIGNLKMSEKEAHQISMTPDMSFNTTIIYSWSIEEKSLNELGIFQMNYCLICPQNYSKESLEGQVWFEQDETSITYVYQGARVCGINFIEITVFIKRHKNLAILIALASIVILLCQKRYKRLALGTIGFQTAIILNVTFLADFEEIDHFNVPTTASFYFSSVFFGFCLGIFTAYSLESAIFLQGLSTSLVLSFTVAMVELLITGIGISKSLYWMILIGFSIISVIIASTPKFPNRLIYLLHINVDQPFYLLMCIGLYFDFYPDLLSQKIFWEYEIYLAVDNLNWLLLSLQLLLSIISVTLNVGGVKYLRNLMNKKMLKNRDFRAQTNVSLSLEMPDDARQNILTKYDSKEDD